MFDEQNCLQGKDHASGFQQNQPEEVTMDDNILKPLLFYFSF